MRVFRLLALGALAVSATACTLWFALDHPYDGLGADAAEDASDAGPDVPDSAGPPMFTAVTSGVGAIAVFDDVLYANTNGSLATCADSTCSLLKILVPVDAGFPDPPGIAADDAGVFWVTGDGIWSSLLDGADAGLVIKDDNNPRVLAADGPRLTWTTQDDAGGTVINSCMVARKGCNFTRSATGPDGGPGSQTSGLGGPIELVDSGSSIDNSQLAAGPGYVLWVSQQGPPTMTYTPVDGGAWTPVNATNDNQFAGHNSTNTSVTNDGPIVFYSFWNKSGEYFVLERSQFPQAQGLPMTNGMLQAIAKSYCLGAGAGFLAYCPTIGQMATLDEYDGSSQGTIPLAPAQPPLNAVVATKSFVFVLDNQHTLYKLPRN